LFSRVIPGRDGKHLYAIGDQRRGRLARYDPKSHQFVEFLGGLSAEGVAISPDGEWAVYTTYPEYTLWRSRLDGSERRQLTFPPMGVFLPRWSSDGSQIVFFGGTSPETYRIYLLPAAGGVPRLATKGKAPEADPSWSPDGRALVFGGTSGVIDQGPTPPVIQRLDVATGRLAPIPGSQGLFSPRWSPDGRWIVALSRDSGRLVIFDVAGERWSDLLPAGPTYGWPSWSADSKEVTFVRGLFRENAILRVRLADRKVETVFDGKGTDLVSGALGPWFGSTPDGWPLELLDAGTHDIYALDWDAP
jgi:Tol biopolymer transport system component